MSTTLRTSALKDIEIKRIQGQSILDFYPQIIRIIRASKNSDLLLSMFAEPNVNRGLGRIVWKTNIVNPPPISLRDCSPEEYKHAMSLLQEAYHECLLLAETYGKSVGVESAGPVALKGMLTTPNLIDCVYLSGDRIIITEWGCIPVGAIPRDFDLIVQSRRDHSDTAIPEPFSQESEGVSTPQSDIYEIQNIPTPTPESSAPISEVPLEIQEHIAANNPEIFIIWRIPLILFLILLILLLLLNCFCSNSHDVRTVNSFSASPINNGDSQSPISIPQQAPTFNDVQKRLEQQSISEGNEANVSLAWNSPADLDLIVVEPNGTSIDFQNRTSPFSNGSIDVDANRCNGMKGCPSIPNPIENISWRQRMPPGKYKIFVSLYSANTDPTLLQNIYFSVYTTYLGKRTEYSGVIKTSDIVCEQTCHSRNLIFVGEINVTP